MREELVVCVDSELDLKHRTAWDDMSWGSSLDVVSLGHMANTYIGWLHVRPKSLHFIKIVIVDNVIISRIECNFCRHIQ
jgi:hypothetical protein